MKLHVLISSQYLKGNRDCVWNNVCKDVTVALAGLAAAFYIDCRKLTKISAESKLSRQKIQECSIVSTSE